MSRAKQIAVVVATDDLPRARDALRAAVGLSLRGDAVRVVLAVEPPADDPACRRALGALREFGHTVSPANTANAAIREADVVEVWT